MPIKNIEMPVVFSRRQALFFNSIITESSLKWYTTHSLPQTGL